MFTNKRLSGAYENARIEYFDNTSKYVFMSDSHRGDDGLSDEFTRNQNIFLHALDHYYEDGFVFVEAGDGDELWEQSSYKYLRLAHRDVYNALKKFFDDGRLILLYGNHNIQLKYPQYVRDNCFYYYSEYYERKHKFLYGIEPQEALLMKHRETGQEILTVHGHQGDFFNDQLWRFSLILSRYFWRFMHVIGLHNPSSPSKNLHKRHKIETAYTKWIQLSKTMLICGHTHRPKFPKNGELPYFNTGCCIHSRGINCIEISDGKILMADWIVRANEDGLLEVKRKVVRGPEPLEKYDFNSNPDLNKIILSMKSDDEDDSV
ncbi:metallophosphoesterase family protein [Parasporobacterium paucivorans]|uniref:UDP-2,3-diacylglucosamine pyrophosphatase LpxH n=1 Tax=Parasporobacterium paucivorans DSM 15970 TaxID=1122934 RepID=A0A1M6BCC7_9FIRM|nr:serine/threonine protein phosphatase [Parasporobacterium paucivorans]SHI46356.1 UDP-2,3-diacylglucosamine pyrophosphatase LpxH [Parasporobacterium paucivorans DSM 15970]